MSLHKALRKWILNLDMVDQLQVADVKSNDNVFLQGFGVPEISKRILQMTNIVVPNDLFMLPEPYTSPGTYMLPLAILNEEGSQISIAVELTPRQATTAELAATPSTA